MLASTRQWYRTLACRGDLACSVGIATIIVLGWFGAVGLSVQHVAAQAWSPAPESQSAATMRASDQVAGRDTFQRKIDRDGDDSSLPQVCRVLADARLEAPVTMIAKEFQRRSGVRVVVRLRPRACSANAVEFAKESASISGAARGRSISNWQNVRT